MALEAATAFTALPSAFRTSCFATKSLSSVAFICLLKSRTVPSALCSCCANEAADALAT
eukprot:CAMPEP_0183564878 /NCGR_PEP_ID=MMETSP0371-20130417/106858_1 /TAXON_ID=268820 /ORGANISM="Peridinium aciculiferum, Strain PAER-2" /LENGTH=58 /DNA_ID=CAMNT_0025773955 /DNA_START=124 /DNA_END=297 /DNA_ORIENTATION=+